MSLWMQFRGSSTKALQIYHNEIEELKLDWENVVMKLGSAYRKAFEAYKKVNLAEPIEYKVAAGVLDLVTWGTTKWVGMVVESEAEKRKKMYLKDWVYEPALESAKLISGHAVSAVKDKMKSDEASRLPADPFEFEKNLKIKLNQLVKSMLRSVNEQINSAPASDNGYTLNFDLHQARQRSWYFHPPKNVDKWDTSKMEFDMELCMWCTWLVKNRAPRYVKTTCSRRKGVSGVQYRSCTVKRHPKLGRDMFLGWAGNIEEYLIDKFGAKMGQSAFAKLLHRSMQNTTQHELRALRGWAQLELQQRRHGNVPGSSKSGWGGKLPPFVKNTWGIS